MSKRQKTLEPPPLPPPLTSPSPPPEPKTGPGLSLGPEMEPEDLSSSTSTETSESEWWNPRTMEHRDFGDAVDEQAPKWTLISQEHTPGNYAASPDAPPVELDPVCDWL